MRYTPIRAFYIKATPLAEGADTRLRWNMMGPVDEATIGDYELHLIGSPLLPYPQLALQRKGRDFTDLEQQFDRTPVERGVYDLQEAKRVIRKWLNEYQGLIVATHDTTKIKAYKVFLARLGFKTVPDDIMGQPILLVQP